MIVPAIRRMARPVEELTVHPRNDHHQGDVGAICQSLERFGQLRPILVQKSTGYVVAGNHVLLAARALGWPKVAAVVTEMSDEDALAYLVADNRLPQLGTFDDQGVADLLGDLTRDGGLEGTGYDGEDYGRLLADLARDEETPGGADHSPAPPDDPASRPGEVYPLGPHRLMCGDSAVREQVEHLQEGRVPDAVVTDPPYGVDFNGEPWDDPGKRHDLVAAVFGGAPSCLAWTPGTANLLHDLATFGEVYVVVWDKGFSMTRSGLCGAHVWEPVLVRSPRRRGLATDVVRAATDRVSVGGQDLLGQFPAPKPVGLFRTLIEALTEPGDVIHEPFGGSGTTLVAAHLAGRTAQVMEQSPAYCDVIRQRYADLVGDQRLAPS